MKNDIEKMYPQKEFLQKDFMKLTSGLTERYNPRDLAPIANVAAVLLAMHHVCNELEQHGEVPHTYKEFMAATPIVPYNPLHGTGGYVKDEIWEELEGAEKYFKRWQETQDENYKSMAKDELRHADFLLKQHHNDNPMKTQEYAHKYNQLLKDLN